MFRTSAAFVLCVTITSIACADDHTFFESHCYECHDASAKQAGLDLSSLKFDLASADNFARWVKVYDRISSGEMPPKAKERPAADETNKTLAWLEKSLIDA